jgi:hypothetical protein
MLRFAAGLLCVLTAFGAGCSRSPAPPKTVAATLRVTLPDGRPLQAKDVRLVPERGAAAPNREVEAVGRPAADGTYALTTFQPGDGAVPGKYVVVIKAAGRGVDPRFRDEETSGLKVTVPSNGGTIEVKVVP